MAVLDAVRTYGRVRSCVVASSDKAYGELCEQRAYIESDPLNGLHPYEASKSCGDLLAQTYLKSYNLPVGFARCGNIYGGGDLNWNRLIPNTIRRIIRGKRPVIYGTGYEIRDFFYVEDAVSAYLALGEQAGLNAFNFSSEREATVIETIKTICEVMGYDADIEIGNNSQGEIFYQHLDCKRAERELNWKARYSFEEGIARTVDWYKNYLGS